MYFVSFHKITHEHDLQNMKGADFITLLLYLAMSQSFYLSNLQCKLINQFQVSAPTKHLLKTQKEQRFVLFSGDIK